MYLAIAFPTDVVSGKQTIFPVLLCFIDASAAFKLSKETEEEKVTLAKKVMAFDAYAESFYDCLNNKKLNYKIEGQV